MSLVVINLLFTNPHWPLVFIVGLSLFAISLTYRAAQGRVKEDFAYSTLVMTAFSPA